MHALLNLIYRAMTSICMSKCMPHHYAEGLHFSAVHVLASVKHIISHALHFSKLMRLYIMSHDVMLHTCSIIYEYLLLVRPPPWQAMNVQTWQHVYTCMYTRYIIYIKLHMYE